MLFANRAIAGRQLAHKLTRYANRRDVVVLALPRGGVPVGFEIAEELDAPLDVFVVRKLGVPGREELAFGAVAGDGVIVLDEDLVARLRISPSVVEAVAAREREELARHDVLYHDGTPHHDLADRIAILTDEGAASTASLRAAIAALKRLRVRRVVLAIPVAPPDCVRDLARCADEVVYVATPEPFRTIGFWYDRFDATPDDDVTSLLRRRAERAIRPALV